MMIPVGAKSKNASVGNPCSLSALAASTLGGVPISVMLPPSRDEKASGIRSLAAGTLACLEIAMTAGMSTAVAPMLFMNADIVPQVSMIVATSRGSLCPATFRIRAPIMSATPVMKSPPETMYTAQTVTTAGLAKPSKTACAGTRPVKATVRRTSIAITSTRKRSVAKSTTAAMMIPSVRMIDGSGRLVSIPFGITPAFVVIGSTARCPRRSIGPYPRSATPPRARRTNSVLPARAMIPHPSVRTSNLGTDTRRMSAWSSR